ncbi:MAG: hypothetical protein A2015_03305 [Spirochaetes bacterium GWF1_31_7]|nr:MAG: hypothetical protein A2Y30_07390 [Spirochaetes bacterium GWE1_32_154]OHD48408.1 MAG: hypothetical protein A2Y29_05265 [Spirochaetes bacterium GWE2_31_10]OHD50884.1 MAG: hypothetical protein A2015_03305 [Spirochaetes bacterium GWF1_31_7]OHD83068.1 MAG: hypothetical protein A2355_09140 [Spirochaetes bacterium RIFOXYB1_FULL_32_8]HBD92723.1 hypothetical protein [Spirochaetia bacterium]
MKRLVISSVFILLLVSLFSREEVLIDFSSLNDTTVDFSKDVDNGWGMNDAQGEMIASLDPSNWSAKVRKSSQIPVAVNKTYVLNVTNSINYSGSTVLAVRSYFPERNAHSDVEIYPPFEIPAYYDDPANPDGMGTYFLNKGVIRNVGVMRKLSIRILGNNFNFGLYVRVKNNSGEERDIYMGTLNFLGWRTLTWINPNYETEKKNRDKTRSKIPYYPDEYPYLKFIGIIIQRDKTERTGNFTTMIKEITADFDEHFLRLDNYEYLQEDIFGIYKEELLKRARFEMERVNKTVYLQWLESQRMHSSTTGY